MFRTRADYELSLISRSPDEEAAIAAELSRHRIDPEILRRERIRFAERNGGTGRSGQLSVKLINGELDSRQGEPYDPLRNY